jgi:hypothetical protein
MLIAGQLRCRRFQTIADLPKATQRILCQLHDQWFWTMNQRLIHRQERCVQADYITLRISNGHCVTLKQKLFVIMTLTSITFWGAPLLPTCVYVKLDIVVI